MSAVACFHCGLPVPPGARWAAQIEGALRPMCCPGCQAVAETICGLGLDAYYERRDAPALRREDAEPTDRLVVYDDPTLQREFVRVEEGARAATFSIDGMRCAACAWLIERRLRDEPGVLDAQVGLATPRARVRWDPRRTRVSALLGAVSEVGYRARPDALDGDRAERAARRSLELQRDLRRLGVAGLGAMQVMTYAVALYAGALQGIEPEYRDFLRAVSWLVATGVVLYAARPFFERAWRDLRALRPGMDVPVALAIGSAYLASSWATLRGTGEVYFDSVCMFAFFLGLGRTIEGRVRARSEDAVAALLARAPQTARRVDADGDRWVPRRALAVGDRVIVAPGETIPADGTVLEGESAVSEALITGEAEPRRRGPGDAVIGGSQNVDGSLLVSVSRVGAASTLASIAALLDRAQLEKIPLARAADRVARGFVVGVLATAACVGFVWWRIAPGDAFWVVLSLLVVTCPCALSLATPVALATATHRLARDGFLVTRGHTLETLARADRFVFDKTGTLTGAVPAIAGVVAVANVSAGEALARARALEQRSLHPIARAFAQCPAARTRDAEALESVASCGVAGVIDGRRHRLGRPAWVAGVFCGEAAHAKLDAPIGSGSWVLLGDAAGPIAWFRLLGELRPGAADTVRWLCARGRAVTLLSGDPSDAEVTRIAEQLGIDEVIAGADPERKIEVLRAYQDRGEVVAAVGDGVNDAPLLAGAHVSIAMGGGTDLSRATADAVLLGDRLPALVEAVQLARRTRRVVAQNLAWALCYNAAAVPLAALGAIPPYLAALGMSASSLAVVCNALRLGRTRRRNAGPRRAEGAGRETAR